MIIIDLLFSGMVFFEKKQKHLFSMGCVHCINNLLNKGCVHFLSVLEPIVSIARSIIDVYLFSLQTTLVTAWHIVSLINVMKLESFLMGIF
jgi:hypothetical protein